MKRLFAVTAVMCLFFGVMVAGCVLYGRREPTPDVLGQYGITQCGTTWCYKGITVGSTSWADAVAILGRSNEVSSNAVTAYVRKDYTVAATIYHPIGKTIVSQVSLVFMSGATAPTVGSLIARYGAPCVLDISVSDRTYLTFRYLSMTFYSDIYHAAGPYYPLPSEKPVLDPQLLVSLIYLSANSRNDCVFLSVPQPDVQQIFSVAWQGFAAERKFLASAYSELH